MDLSAHSLTSKKRILSIQSLIESGTLASPLSFSALPLSPILKLALKLFRGEPAITKFDWNFSPIHSSSPSVARLVGSGLPKLLHLVHPGHE